MLEGNPKTYLSGLSLKLTLRRLANVSSKSSINVLASRNLIMMSSTSASVFLPNYGPNVMCINRWKVAPVLLSPKGMQV